MGNTNTTYTFIVGGGFSIFAYLFGGFDNLLLSLAVFMGVDFLTGIMVGAKNGFDQAMRQRETGIKEAIQVGISSRKAFMGLMRKAAMILAIIIAVQLDILMGNDGEFMRRAMILFFIGSEGISFIENIGKLGVKLPPVFVKAFSQLTNETHQEKSSESPDVFTNNFSQLANETPNELPNEITIEERTED